MSSQPVSTSLKRIDFEAGHFKGLSGKTYFIELGAISTGRYAIYEQKAMEVGFGVDFKSVFGSFATIYKQATTGDSTLQALHKITEICHSQMAKLKTANLPKDEFLFCSIFMNTEDEDRSKWDVDLAKAKIDDWAEYDARDFFLASRLGVEGYATALNLIEEIPKVKKKNGKGHSQ